MVIRTLSYYTCLAWNLYVGSDRALFTTTGSPYATTHHLYHPHLLSAHNNNSPNFFFANRIRLFSGKWLVPVLTWILAVLVLAFSIAMVAILCIHDTVEIVVGKFRWLMALTLALTTAADGLIVASMCYWLWNARSSGFQKTRTIAETLITWSIESTVIKSVPNILQLVLFLSRNDLLWIIFYFMKASLFSNSMLASLNGRKRMAEAFDSNGPTFINFNSAVPGPQGAIRNRNVVIQMTRMTETHVDDSVREGSGSGLESKTECECPSPLETHIV